MIDVKVENLNEESAILMAIGRPAALRILQDVAEQADRERFVHEERNCPRGGREWNELVEMILLDCRQRTLGMGDPRTRKESRRYLVRVAAVALAAIEANEDALG